MLYKYFKFTKKKIAVFLILLTVILSLQYVLSGSMVSKQTIVTEAGNANSSVIGIIDNEEIIRQKFSFERKVVLSKFTLSFGSFKKENVGDNLNIQMTDGDNNVVYSTVIPVDKINANPSKSISRNSVFSHTAESSAAAIGSLAAKRLDLAAPIRLIAFP